MKKTMFVTGATKNTGWAIARRFAADGWDVVLTSRDASSAETAAAKLKAEFPSVDALGVAMDPVKVDDIRGGFAAVKERFGRLDAFVNNAAHLGVGLSVLNSTEADWDAVMNANARAAFFGSQVAVKLMEGGGSIVFISSCHAVRSVPGRALYTASKAAVGGLTRSLAVELGCLGIRVNAILAGAIRTDRWDALTDDEIVARRARWPAGVESTPDEIAAAVAFLCSDAARTITGTEIPIDSGVGVSLLQYNKDWMKNDEYNVKYWEKKK
ncbi:MAG: SDR family oxidoreductase [Kiritimatiellae bacterium]|nr:SDR family oxidoreductase [Kiritimatiellia bacterium]